MRFVRAEVVLMLFFMPASALWGGEEVYRGTKSNPKLCLAKVTVPKDKSEPLTLRFDLIATDDDPVAISREQLSIHIDRTADPFLFECDPIFPKGASKVFIAKPGAPVEITVTSSANRHGNRKGWGAIRPGEYNVRVYVNSGKEQEFDYQWLGSTQSDAYRLKID